MNKTFRSWTLAATILAGLSLTAVPAKANIFQTGDVVAGLSASTPELAIYSSTGTLQTTLSGGGLAATSIATFGSQGVLIANGSSNILEINQSGVVSNFLTQSGQSIDSVLVDSNNNVFTIGWNNITVNSTQETNTSISEYNSTGTLVSSKNFVLPNSYNGAIYGSLSANEQNLFVTDLYANGIESYNIASGTLGSMPGLAGTTTSFGQIQVLANGNILDPAWTSGVLEFNPTTGAQVAQYTNVQFKPYGMAIDATGTSFWTSSYGGIGGTSIYQTILSSGLNVMSVSNSASNVTGLGVIGSQTAITQVASQTGGTTSVPEPASAALLLGMLGMLALVKRKHA